MKEPWQAGKDIDGVVQQQVPHHYRPQHRRHELHRHQQLQHVVDVPHVRRPAVLRLAVLRIISEHRAHHDEEGDEEAQIEQGHCWPDDRLELLLDRQIHHHPVVEGLHLDGALALTPAPFRTLSTAGVEKQLRTITEYWLS